MFLFLLIWSAAPLRHVMDAAWLPAQLEAIRSSPLGLVGVTATFIALATAGFSLVLLIAATGAILDAPLAIPVCMLGVTVSAFLSFNAGRLAPRGIREFLARRLPENVRRRLKSISVVGVVVLRHIPIAPYAVVNAACGAVGVPQGSFLAGTFIGMVPSILLLTYLGQEATTLFTDPSPASVAKVAGIVVATVAVAAGADRVFRKLESRRRRQPEERG